MTIRQKLAILFTLISLASVIAFAQGALSTYPSTFSHNVYMQLGIVPGSMTPLIARSVAVDTFWFANDDASNTATIRAVDGTTNCGSAACPILPDVTLAPKSVVSIQMLGQISTSGLSWQVTGSTQVAGSVKFRY